MTRRMGAIGLETHMMDRHKMGLLLLVVIVTCVT